MQLWNQGRSHHKGRPCSCYGATRGREPTQVFPMPFFLLHGHYNFSTQWSKELVQGWRKGMVGGKQAPSEYLGEKGISGMNPHRKRCPNIDIYGACLPHCLGFLWVRGILHLSFNLHLWSGHSGYFLLVPSYMAERVQPKYCIPYSYTPVNWYTINVYYGDYRAFSP